jgi:pyridoxal phosphate enzyme (YggS family)
VDRDGSVTPAWTPEEVASRLAEVRREIDAVDRPWNHDVEVLAVTKGFGGEAIEAAVAAGCRSIGENYAQELLEKRVTLEEIQPVVHFIGRLQSNKVKQLVEVVDVWASVDRAGLVEEIARRAPGARVLVQVDTTCDPAKGGCPVAETPTLVGRAGDLGLLVEGLMTVGPTGEPPDAARSGFRTVRHLADELGLSVCSMGMSGDLAVAVEEGSTQVRIGTALFGPRPPRR